MVPKADDHLVISPSPKPRQGWEEAFRRMHKDADDRLLDKDSLRSTRWERTEWQW